MTPDVVGACGCGVQLVTWWRWTHLPVAVRAELREAGYARKNAENECDRCSHRRRRYNPSRRPPSFYTRGEVLAEWERFVDRRESKARNIEALAPRLGMTPAALEKALDRAGVKAWPASPAPRGWTPQAEAS